MPTFAASSNSVDHEWLLRMLAHRVADPRVLRLVRQWLRAGVIDGGTWQSNDEGTPQGAGISPLLSNIFLHYALDLWVQKWRRQEARGRVIVVRYADDFVMGLEHESDARRMMADSQGAAGRVWAGAARGQDPAAHVRQVRHRTQGGARAWASRDVRFPGFYALLRQNPDGRFIVRRKTQRKRMIRKLKEMRLEMRQRMHIPVTDQWRWLTAVLRGHYGYYGLTGNYRAMKRFLQEVEQIWQRSSRSSQPKVADVCAKVSEAAASPSHSRSHHHQPVQDSARNIASGYSQEEPSARKTHARICEGGVG